MANRVQEGKDLYKEQCLNTLCLLSVVTHAHNATRQRTCSSCTSDPAPNCSAISSSAPILACSLRLGPAVLNTWAMRCTASPPACCCSCLACEENDGSAAKVLHCTVLAIPSLNTSTTHAHIYSNHACSHSPAQGATPLPSQQGAEGHPRTRALLERPASTRQCMLASVYTCVCNYMCLCMNVLCRNASPVTTLLQNQTHTSLLRGTSPRTSLASSTPSSSRDDAPLISSDATDSTSDSACSGWSGTLPAR